MKFGTKAIHAGVHPDPTTGAIMTLFIKLLPLYKKHRESIKDLVTQEEKILRVKHYKIILLR